MVNHGPFFLLYTMLDSVALSVKVHRVIVNHFFLLYIMLDSVALSVKVHRVHSKPWSIFMIVQYAGLCGLVSKSAQSYSKPWSIFTIVQYAGLCGFVSKVHRVTVNHGPFFLLYCTLVQLPCTGMSGCMEAT